MKYKYYIGIDVSKFWLDVACIYYNDPTFVQRKRFSNSKKDFLEIINWIKSNHPVQEECLICFEETGTYSYKLWEYLSKKKWNFLMERGMEIRKSSGIRRGKSDIADAEMIARYIFLRGNYINLTTPPISDLTRLKALLTFRDRILKTILRFKTTAAELRNNFNKKIYGSIPKQSDAIVKDFTKKAIELEEKILRLIESNEQLNHLYELIISVPGLGLYSAAHILVYTKAFSKHLDYRKFSCYCGMAPFEYSSGLSIGKARIHVIGNKKMKALLSRGAIAIATKKNNPSEFGLYYRRKIAEGKPALVVLNVIKNKMISRVYAAVKRGTPYVKNYNRLIPEE